jgi:heptosyltransferase II
LGLGGALKELKPGTIHRLLVRGTNWVGDAVMSLPALKLLRQVFPSTHISLLVLPWVSGIYEGQKFVDEVLLYDRSGRHHGMMGRIRLIRELRREPFDAAVLLQNAFEAALLTRLAGIPFRGGYDRDGRGWLLSHPVPIDPRVAGLHQAYYYLDLVERLVGGPRQSLQIQGQHENFMTNRGTWPDISISVHSGRQRIAREKLKGLGLGLQKKLVGVNPGAFYGSAKRWLSERYAALLDRLMRDLPVETAIFGAPNELAIAQTIQSQMQSPAVILTGKTDLAELIAMISLCDLFITNDSGPMHLAAALGIPTLAIFGPTDEIATGPLSPTAVVMKKRVECSPCLLRECPIDHRCMTRMTVDEVFEQAERMLRTPGVAALAGQS